MSDYLPAELLIQILLKLPVKSLICFTTVCKSWQSLITSPTFIASHLSNHKNQTLLLRRYDKNDKREHYSLHNAPENGSFEANSSSEFKIPFKSKIGYFRIVGSCDGLVCLSDDLFSNPSQPIIIWNPSVRNHVILPEASFNPINPHIVVLGFGVASNVYKVVRLVYRRDTDYFGFRAPPWVEVFSIKTFGWQRVRGVDVRLRILEFMWCQAFLNGVVHWLGYEPNNDDSSRSSILAFHVGPEVFCEVMLPDELAKEAVTKMCIVVVGESLGVIKYSGEISSKSCDVWIMKEYCVKESWIKLYSIDSLEGVEKVVRLWKSGEALLALNWLDLVSYNLETREAKDLGICGTTRSFYVDNYIESLLLVKRHSGAIEEELSGDELAGLNMDGWCIT